MIPLTFYRSKLQCAWLLTWKYVHVFQGFMIMIIIIFVNEQNAKKSPEIGGFLFDA